MGILTALNWVERFLHNCWVVKGIQKKEPADALILMSSLNPSEKDKLHESKRCEKDPKNSLDKRLCLLI